MKELTALAFFLLRFFSVVIVSYRERKQLRRKTKRKAKRSSRGVGQDMEIDCISS